jgi:hypothetical protein
MAITITNKASVFLGTNLSAYSTGSQTPTASRLQIASVVNYNNLATDPATPTLSGNGLTWSQLVTYLPDNGGTKVRLTVFVTLTGGSPSAGVVTADFGGETQLGCSIIVDEVDGADISGTALAAIVQTVTGTENSSGTSETITLAALADANNASYGVIQAQVNETFTVGSGYTEILQGSHAGPLAMLLTEYQVPGSTTVDASWTTSIRRGGAALEIAVASGGGTTTTLTAEAGSFAANGQATTFSTSIAVEHGSFS